MSAPRLIPLAPYARLLALLGPARGGRAPTVLAEDRQILTGLETRQLTVGTGVGEEVQTYVGPSMTGLGLAALKAERERLRELDAALREVRRELEGVIAAIEG